MDSILRWYTTGTVARGGVEHFVRETESFSFKKHIAKDLNSKFPILRPFPSLFISFPPRALSLSLSVLSIPGKIGILES